MTDYKPQAQSFAIITGASSGLGVLFAEAFAGRGQNLILVARSGDKLEALATDLRKRFPVTVDCVTLDLSRPESAGQLYDATLGKPISTLVNNAGVAVTGAFAEGDRQKIQEMLTLNVETLTGLTSLYLPQIKSARGAVINVASHAG